MNTAESSPVTLDLTWRKSSYSGAEGGDCVEVAAGTGSVHIRDSKAVTGPLVKVSREAWTDFVEHA
ncbi:DUF397 domain-containing protein [Streptomyces sp. bgisy022]|uniref:DUF397 domain-containing protein n=1 Tax=Streptomyces sp. bgisy022 TaxID=3413769 RepID=UPI003D703A2F